MTNLTFDYLSGTYGELYKDELLKCTKEKTEISLHPDTLYRLEEEMKKRGENIQSIKIGISEMSTDFTLAQFVADSNRNHFLFLIISGLRSPRIVSRLNDIVCSDKYEIQLAMVRKEKEPFVNEIIVLAY